MKRSLLVTDSPIWTAETEYAAAVAAAEAAAGVEVTVAAPRGSAVAGVLETSARLVDLPGAEPRRSPADFVANVRFLSDLVARSAFDVAHSSRSSAHLATALAVGGRAPLVHLRGGASAPAGHPANRHLYRRMTAAVVVSSGRIRDWVVERLRVDPGRVHRILAPVDVERFQPAPPDDAVARELGLPAGAPLVVNVARLAPVKGHEVLLRAMATVTQRVPEARLVLLGEPWSGQPEGLARLAADLGIEESVVFAGRRDDVSRVLSAAAVCVTSSVGSEENSRAVSEYMACGRPVVATTVGVIPELVDDGATGLLVRPDDVSGLASAIARLLADRDLSRRLGEGARASALERFSREAFARGLRDVLESTGVSS